MAVLIRAIDNQELEDSARVVRDSFATVARDFGLTEASVPTHPAFITTMQLRRLKDKGVKLFGLFEDSAARPRGRRER
jgi:diamine N-acetyltransferase